MDKTCPSFGFHRIEGGQQRRSEDYSDMSICIFRFYVAMVKVLVVADSGLRLKVVGLWIYELSEKLNK